MSSELNKEELFAQAIEEEVRSSVKILVSLGTVLFPLFSVLDFLTHREHYEILSLNRFSTTFIFLGFYFFLRTGNGLRRPALTLNLILSIAALSITLMCVSLKGSASPYYAGVNLVVLAAVVLFPVRASQMARTVMLVIAIYFFGILFTENFRPDLPSFINNLAFLLATGVIGVSAAHYTYKLKREAFFKTLEVRRSAQALNLRDGFISMASHELRTPLTSMKLQLDVAMLKMKDGETKRDEIQQSLIAAYRQIGNMSRLIDEMLDVSRIQSGKFIIDRIPCELNQIVLDTLARTYPRELGSSTILLRNHQGPLSGSWDPFKIEQVILNLVNNSLKYGEGSELLVETGRDDEFAFVRVSDHGPGILPEDQARIFERFERGSSVAGGLGLGLFICKEIAESHGGRIILSSIPGETTSFTVYLPVTNSL